MNIFDIPNGTLQNELTDSILERKAVRIERIVSDHHTTGWYDQEEDEWVCLLKGEADIQFEDSIRTLREGDTLLISKHQRHRVSRTTKCVWLCVFMGD